MSRPPEFDEAAREFDPASAKASEHAAEQQREETLRRYPRERWPEMPLEDYALGQADHPENFCRWIERQTDQMGSIRGGSARKLIIYKHADKPGWYFPPSLYADEREAWDGVRAGFVQAFELADQGRWSEIDSIEALAPGPALLLKTLWTYFPEDLLPITSTHHLRHFLRIVGDDPVADDDALGAVQLNRNLLTAIRETPRDGEAHDEGDRAVPVYAVQPIRRGIDQDHPATRRSTGTNASRADSFVLAGSRLVTFASSSQRRPSSALSMTSSARSTKRRRSGPRRQTSSGP